MPALLRGFNIDGCVLARRFCISLVGLSQPTFNLKVSVMIKQKSDPFLVQASMMLVILLVVYVIGGDTGSFDHLLSAR